MDKIASIELAIANEKTEMEFYQQEANRTDNELAKQIFIQLAKDESEHMQRIQELHHKLMQDGSWPTDLPLSIAGTQVRQDFEELVTKRSSAEDATNADIAALQHAIEFEQKGYRFYMKLAEACSNPAEKAFFNFLSRIEREHYLSLDETLQYLEDPHSWLLVHERVYLDG